MPANIDITVNADPSAAGPAISGLIDSVAHARQRWRQARLDNDAREQNMDDATARATHEAHMRELEIEEHAIALAEKRLGLRKAEIAVSSDALDVERKAFDYALDSAAKMVDLLHPDPSDPARAALMRDLLPRLLDTRQGQALQRTLPSPHDPTP